MIPSLRRFPWLLLAATSLAAWPADLRAASSDLPIAEVTTALDVLYRRVPACEAADPESWLNSWARQGEKPIRFAIKTVAGRERLPIADGRPSPIELQRVEIAGQDTYAAFHSFLLRMARNSQRLFDVEALQLKAVTGNKVRFMAHLAVPCYAGPVPAENDRGAYENVAVAAEAYLRLTHRLLQELTDRSRPARLVDALDALARESSSQALALTAARMAQDVELEGVVVGTSARAGLEPALARAGFRAGRVTRAEAGRCQRFVVSAQLDGPASTGEGASDPSLFDDRVASFCQLEPVLGRIAVPRATGVPETRALLLHLRDVELVDLFYILHQLTEEGFVIAPEAHGRVTIDVEGATLEQSLAAFSAVGVKVGPGPLHQVSKTGPAPAAPAVGPAGELVTFSLRRIELSQLLCTLERVSQGEITASRHLAGHVSVFARDVPWDQVLAAAASAVGLVAMHDEKGWFVGPTAIGQRGQDFVDVCQIQSPGDSDSRLAARQEAAQVSVSDLELAGLARLGGGWRAYVYTPSRSLLSLEPGQALRDGRVGTIDLGGISFVTGGPPVTLPLSP